ncbi:MAG: HEAT repeat domain-containing protein [Ginsengibacter sp.]
MPGFLLTFFLTVDYYFFLNVIYVFLVLLFLLSIFISVFTIYKRRVERNKKLWQQSVAPVISEAIFYNDEEEERVDLLYISYKIEMLLKNSRFRQYIINELIQVKKTLSGSSNLNLNRLFEILDLDKDSFRKLNNMKWHIKAKGIQELGIMGQIKYAKEIFWLTNNAKEHVRNEAQSALVSFYGFSGLRFLDLTEYPISQWQQIQLLNKLHHVKPANFDALQKWLQSPNESVVIFSLKLATFYNCYDVYTNVIKCLQIASLQVKLNALEYLKKMPQEDTSEQIIHHYSFENKAYKLAVIHALKDIGSEKQIPFLLKKLHAKDDDIKAAAAKSLSYLHPLGNAFLQTHLFADEYPWQAIFLQITNERAA